MFLVNYLKRDARRPCYRKYFSNNFSVAEAVARQPENQPLASKLRENTSFIDELAFGNLASTAIIMETNCFSLSVDRKK